MPIRFLRHIYSLMNTQIGQRKRGSRVPHPTGRHSHATSSKVSLQRVWVWPFSSNSTANFFFLTPSSLGTHRCPFASQKLRDCEQLLTVTLFGLKSLSCKSSRGPSNPITSTLISVGWQPRLRRSRHSRAMASWGSDMLIAVVEDSVSGSELYVLVSAVAAPPARQLVAE